MSTTVNTVAAHGVADDAVGTAIGTKLSDAVRRVVASWSEAVALRRNLHEIGQLSERELTDIGLTHDEIHRLRSSHVFTPLSWQSPRVTRGDLPF